MFFVIGLGNPGRRYAGTRHNIGFEVVDLLSRRLNVTFKEGRGDFLIATGSHNDTPLALVKPQTFMNESGLALLEVREQFEIQLHNLLVVCDDFQLPLGQLRLRARGSDGGHNGLSSVIYHLQSEEFPRLRCGIGSPSMPEDKNLMAEFVLDRFEAEEIQAVNGMVEQAADASLLTLAEGLTRAMNVFNKKLVSDSDSQTP